MGMWVALVLTAALYFAWTPAGDPRSWTGDRPSGHYDLYVDAILAGQAHLPIAVAPELAALADPYDPATNAPYRINDLSYRDGRYYLYLGVTPVLVLLAPFKAVTGLYLSERAATLVFCVAGLIASLALLRMWQRSVAPRAPAGCVALAMASLVAASGYAAVIRTDGSNQVPIAAAYAFGAWAMALASRYLLLPRPRLIWLVASSACFGFAIGARPNFAPAAICLLAIPFHLWRSGQGRAATGLSLVAIGLPVTLAVAAILAWNQIRFGHPLEFGQHLMLGAWDQRTLANSSLVSAWENTVHYLFGLAHYHSHFPFVRPPSWQAIGLLIHVPLIWVGAMAGWRWRPGPGTPGRAVLVATLLLAGINLLVLILLPSGNTEAVRTSANSRYALDFQPYFALLIALALTLAGHRVAERIAARRWLLAIGGAALLASALSALSVDFARLPASSYRRVAEVLNLPTWLGERIRGTEYGAVVLRLRFPSAAAGTTESLLSIGTGEDRTAVYATYPADGLVRLGVFNTLLGGPEAPAIAFELNRDYRLEISIGALYPAMGAPDYAGVDSARITGLLRTVELRLDGKPLLVTVARFDPAAPNTLSIGQATPWSSPAGHRFSGTLVYEGRNPLRAHLPESTTEERYGPVRLTVRFPRDRSGTQEPLVVSGVPQAGNFAYVRYVDQNHIQLGFDHWGTAGVISPVLALDYGATHIIEVDHDGLLPKSEVRARNRVSMRLNGEEVLAAQRGSYASDAADVTIGINPIGGSTCGYLFTGEIIAVERLPLAGP